MAAKYELNDESVIVVVGSGAGGGTLANELCQKGHKVVCLEAGNHLEWQDIVNDEFEMYGKLTWQDPRTGQPIWIVKAVGGSTLHWAGLSIRFKEYELKTRTTYGSVAGANLLDWPISLKELEPYYDKAEMKMGVTGTQGIPRQPETNAFKVVNYCAKKAGYSFEMGPSAINSVVRDGRPACQMIGFCTSGCKIGAKWSTLYTEIPKAMETGNFELRPDSMVLQIQHDAKGKVTGVLYADKNGKHQVQKARIVCAAANSIESPRLLLNSASSTFPHGLANSSGQIGKNYMRHTTGSVFGIFKEPVHMYRGTVMAGIVGDEAAPNLKRGFAGGFEFETISLGLPFTAAFLKPGAWGREYTDLLEQYPKMAGMWIVGEDMPQETNAVTLHPTERDAFGLPVPNVHYDDHANDLAMRTYAFKRGSAIYDAVGAVKTIQSPPYPSTHNLGTCRQSDKQGDGVCNKWGQTHDIKNLFISDGSQFTTSAAENPTLTIVSLAIRQADYIADQSAKKNL